MGGFCKGFSSEAICLQTVTWIKWLEEYEEILKIKRRFNGLKSLGVKRNIGF